MGEYHAFYFSSYHAEGGLNDYIGSFDDIESAKNAIVKAIESSNMGYWGRASGEIVISSSGKLETAAYLYAYLKGNVEVCKIDTQCCAWGINRDTAEKLALDLALQYNRSYLR